MNAACELKLFQESTFPWTSGRFVVYIARVSFAYTDDRSRRGRSERIADPKQRRTHHAPHQRRSAHHHQISDGFDENSAESHNGNGQTDRANHQPIDEGLLDADPGALRTKNVRKRGRPDLESVEEIRSVPRIDRIQSPAIAKLDDKTKNHELGGTNVDALTTLADLFDLLFDRGLRLGSLF